MKLYELEFGLIAICWTCGKKFVKNQPCDKCEFFICPHCGRCGCHLSDASKKVARSIILTMALNGLLPVDRDKKKENRETPNLDDKLLSN